MENIEKFIDIDQPVEAVYEQWMQFEDFPHFMEGIEEVRQIDDRRLHWKAVIAGKEKEWDAEIIEQIPGESISWRSLSGAQNSGTVTFTAINPTRTRVTLNLSYIPEGLSETIGDLLGLVSARVSADLGRFKEFIELRGASTEDWRSQPGRAP